MKEKFEIFVRSEREKLAEKEKEFELREKKMLSMIEDLKKENKDKEKKSKQQQQTSNASEINNKETIALLKSIQKDYDELHKTNSELQKEFSHLQKENRKLSKKLTHENCKCFIQRSISWNTHTKR